MFTIVSGSVGEVNLDPFSWHYTPFGHQHENIKLQIVCVSFPSKLEQVDLYLAITTHWPSQSAVLAGSALSMGAARFVAIGRNRYACFSMFSMYIAQSSRMLSVCTSDSHPTPRVR
jgi:hypothetical protein